MRLIFVDDEQSAHTNFIYYTHVQLEHHDANFFFDSFSALAFAQNHPLDCAFLDVSMPSVDGIELARRLKSIQPNIEIVFITAYDTFTKDAYKVGGRAYLTKPYTEQELIDIFYLMERLSPKYESATLVADSAVPASAAESATPSSSILMRTFGNFDFLVNNQPVAFQNAKAKELLAFLVDQKGSTVTSSQIFLHLWEDREYDKATSTYVRRTLRVLKQVLDELCLGQILVSHRNCTSVDISTFTCDYYEAMNGNRNFLHLYNGYYMTQYSWAEKTVPLIDRQKERLNAL